MIPRLSRTAKVSFGVLATYTCYESYFYVRTKNLIRERKDLEGPSKFSSARVSGVFVNPFDEYRPQTAFEFIYVRILEALESLYGTKIEVHDLYPNPEGDFARVEDMLKTFKPNYMLMRENTGMLYECLAMNDFTSIKSARNEGPSVQNQLLFTWLGQSCSLIQLSGINILTDPIFSDHLFNKNFGPKRLVNSPMTIEDVKYATRDNLNFILVSHNHPDHLELGIVNELGNKPTWIVPMGLKGVLANEGITNVIELDWWEKVSLNRYLTKSSNCELPDEYEIVCVPGMHWSGQYVYDANKSLWGSFILRRNGVSVVYHAGDTGYSKKLFDSIGHHYAPVFLSLLPIGQYCPSWHQKPRHISPEECLKIVEHLKSPRMLGVHFGTFKLSSEPIIEPKNLLLGLAKSKGESEHYTVPEFGCTYVYDTLRLSQSKDDFKLAQQGIK